MGKTNFDIFKESMEPSFLAELLAHNSYISKCRYCLYRKNCKRDCMGGILLWLLSAAEVKNDVPGISEGKGKR